MRGTAGAPTDVGLVAVLPRVFLASLAANLPMLALLLVPQLMRSRVGSEALLLVGSTLYCVLIVIALATAPRVSAWGAPRAELWTTPTAAHTARAIRQTQARDYWQRVGEWLLFFLVAQGAGLFVGWLVPYIWDNPEFGAPGQPRWIFRYRNYALHALTIYLFSCLSFAWFGARLRQMSAAR
jgi:hypothetical protein